MAFGITLLSPQQKAALQALTSGGIPSAPAPSVSAPPTPVPQDVAPPPVLSTPMVVAPEDYSTVKHVTPTPVGAPYPYALPGGPSLDTPATVGGGIPRCAWAAGAAALVFLVLRRR